MTTNERLIIAGIEILDEQGMDGFSMRAVTERCGFSSSSVPYEYFLNKQAFFIATAKYVTQQCYEEGEQADLIYLREKGLTEIQAKQYAAMKNYGEKCREHPWLQQVVFLLRSDIKCSVEKKVPVSMRQEPYLMKKLKRKEIEEDTIPYAFTAEMILTLYVYGAAFLSDENQQPDWIPGMDVETCIDFLKKMELFFDKHSI